MAIYILAMGWTPAILKDLLMWARSIALPIAVSSVWAVGSLRPPVQVIRTVDRSGAVIGHQCAFYASDDILITAYHGLVAANRVIVSRSDGTESIVEDFAAESEREDWVALWNRRPLSAPCYELCGQQPTVSEPVWIVSGVSSDSPAVEYGMITEFRNSAIEGPRFLTDIPCEHGDSGGPVVGPSGVWGIVSIARGGGSKRFCVAAPLAELSAMRPTRRQNLSDRYPRSPSSDAMVLVFAAGLQEGTGNRRLAKAMLMKAIQADPSAWVPRSRLFELYLHDRNYTAAARTINEWNDAAPAPPWLICWNRGRLAVEQGRWECADRAFGDSLSLQITVEVALALASSRYQQKDVNAAIVAIEQAIVQYPNDGQLLQALTIYLLARGDVQAAMQAIDSAMVSNRSCEALSLRAKCLSLTGKLSEALALIDAIGDRRDMSSSAASSCGQLLLANKMPRQAIPLLQKAIAIDNHDALLFVRLGMAYEGVENWLEAESAFRQSIDLANTTLAQAGLARVYSATNRKQEALMIVAAIQDIDPKAAEELRTQIDAQ